MDGDSDLDPLLEGKADSAARPSAGRFVSNLIPTADTCGMGVDLSEPDAHAVEVSEDGSKFSFASDGLGISCTMTEGSAYECEVENPAAGVLPVTTTLVGSWISADRFEGEFKMAVNCSGSACEDLEPIFETATELPCATTGALTATRAMPADFAPAQAAYAVDLSGPFPGSSTCKGDVIADALPEQLVLVDKPEGFVMEDVLMPFECGMTDGGGYDCSRSLEVDQLGVVFRSRSMGAFTSDKSAEGGLEVTVECQGEDCSQAEALLGTLPCVSYFDIALQAE